MDEPTVRSWDPLECQAYIVETIGNNEQFPRDNVYYPGFMVVLLRLMERYGEDYYKSYAHVLRAFLEDFSIGTEAEKELWASWRSEHASRIVSKIKNIFIKGS